MRKPWNRNSILSTLSAPVACNDGAQTKLRFVLDWKLDYPRIIPDNLRIVGNVAQSVRAQHS